ncbi:MAG: tetratricopeptide repeat protein [Microcoleus sp.]
MILRRVSTFIALGLLVGGCESLPQVFDLSDEQVKTAAKEITVIIDDCGSAGSGVIFKKDGNTYSVLTADHVVKKAKGNCVILKSDNSQYKASVSEAIVPVAGVDLAVLTFQSDKNHKLAKLGDSDKATDYSKVYVAGAPEPSQAIPNRIIRVEDGKIDNRKLQTNGYDLIYTNKTMRGMSGGPVLNQKGEVIGIHGQGDQEKGIKTGLNLGIPIKTFSAASYFNSANAKFEQRKYEEAIVDLDRAIQLYSNYAYAYVGLGAAKLALGRQDYAIADLERAIQLDSNNHEAYFFRGLVKHQRLERKNAIADYTRAINLNSKKSHYYFNRGLLNSEQWNKKEAIEDFSKVIDLQPKNADAYNNRGLAKSAIGKKDEAIEDFSKAIDLEPKNADAYNNRGLAKSAIVGKKDEAISDYTEAISHYTEALDLDPKNYDTRKKQSIAYTNRGLAQYALGRNNKAISDYNQAMSYYNQASVLDEFKAEIYNNLGLAKYALGKRKEAISDYNLAIKINSQFGPTNSNVVFADPKNHPKNDNVYYNRGLANSALGQKEEAIADYQKAADLFKKQNKTTDYEKVLNQIQKLSAPISPSDDSPTAEKYQSE